MGIRDGMSGSLIWSSVLEIAKINRLEGENLEDFLEFIQACESELSKKRNVDKPKK